MKRLVHKDPITGKETWCHYQDDGGFIFETTQNIDALLKENKKQANNYRAGSLLGNTQKHHQKVADIPAALYHQLVEKLGQPRDNPKGWRQWLNDHDNRFFRTGGGNV